MILLPMVASADAVEIDGIYYNLITKDKVAEVAHTHYTGNIVIPETVDYDNVTYSVTSIGDMAFVECGGLTSITIPNSVTSIGEHAFNGCSGLTSITIPNSVTSIGSWAFSYCSGLTSITIPNSVTRISDYVFSDCSSLTSVTIGSSVTSIGNYAFQNCSGLISITIPNSVTSISNDTFYECSGLTSITIGNSVTSIGNYAFQNCSGLISITIPNSVTSIGIEAFEGCSGLTSVTIPNSVTSIGSFAFDNCYGLKKVIVSDIAAWCGISFNDSFSNPLSFAHHIYSDDNTEIKDMVIPNSVTSIGSYAFNNCSGLTSITIPNSVTSIGRRAFSYCSGLTSITIGSSVTSFGSNVFNGADIPTIISLIENPFAIEGKTSDYDRTFSLNTFNNATLYVPKGTIDKYKATAGWKDFVFIEEGTGGGDTPQKCETPVISYENGKLSFSCDTEDVEYHWSITSSGTGNKVTFEPTVIVSVYASKDDYDDSDITTMELNSTSFHADVNGDGEVNITDVTYVIDIINQQ